MLILILYIVRLQMRHYLVFIDPHCQSHNGSKADYIVESTQGEDWAPTESCAQSLTEGILMTEICLNCGDGVDGAQISVKTQNWVGAPSWYLNGGILESILSQSQMHQDAWYLPRGTYVHS